MKAGDITEGLADFRKAVEGGTALAWPYLFLARDAGEHDKWDEAERLAHLGAACASPGPLRARLLEAEAVAAAMLGLSAEVVTGLFRSAEGENPLDQGIRRNAEAFARASASALRFSGLRVGDLPDPAGSLHALMQGMSRDQASWGG